MIKHLTTRLALLLLGSSTLPAIAADYVLNQETAHIVPLTRGKPYTTHFGWDTFEAPVAPATTLNDTTPDIGNTAIVGARFETLNTQLHRASSGNFYSGQNMVTSQTNEKITVPTSGTVGVTGKTTILVQLIGTGTFPNTWTFSNIDDVAPQIVHGANKGNKGQVWVKWELPGNAATYEFNLGTINNLNPSYGGAHMSFDKMEIDTFWSPTGASIDDTMILSEPVALASILDQTNGLVTPSSRGGNGTTYFGWDTFGTSGVTAPINDNTPDIGSDTTGTARFETMNDEVHQFSGGGNLYLLSFAPPAKTLDENITVPTKGIVGTAGYTTIILQIVSADSGMGGSDFSGEIFLKPINGVTPTIVQGPSVGTAHLWAKWVIPGNQASYTIEIDGVSGQEHYSFDKVIVDTKYSLYAPVGDTMRAKTVEITTAVLASAVRGTTYTAQLAATGGTTPHSWSLAAESTLPAGLELSASGLISGTPTAAGNTTFTVVATDAAAYKNQATYVLEVLAPVTITSTTLPNAVTGLAYSATLAAEGGRSAYEWALASGSSLPAGLELSTAGVISGTPAALGATTFSVTVTDSSDLTATNVLTLEVAPPVSITNTILPMGVIGVPYYATFTAEGGQGEYEWALAAGSLPAGLELSTAGLISGIPTSAVNTTISVRVTDSSDATVTKNFDITISNLAIVTASLPTAVVGEAYSASIQAAGGVAPYAWEIAGTPPAGVTFNSTSTTGNFTGTPTESGTFTLTVRVTDDAGLQISKTITLVVSGTYLKPVVDPITFPVATIGATYSHTVTAANYPKKFSITGLPKGLTFSATGGISGRPSVSGAYLVQVRATNSAGVSVIRPGTLIVKALPANLVGTFTGLVDRNTFNSGHGSLFNLTTTTTGAYTLQVKTAATTKSYKGFLNTGATQVEADLGESELKLNIHLETMLITGFQIAKGNSIAEVEPNVEGWRTKWNLAFNPASGREGYYSVALGLKHSADLENAALPQGTGFATFTVVPAGTLKIAGKTADGQALVSATTLGPNGEIAIYSPAYANKGTVHGKWTLEDNDFLGNTVEGDLTWQKPVTTGLTYPAAFGPLDVAVKGGYLAPSAKGPVMAGLPEEGSIQVKFEAGGIDTYETFAEVQTASGFGWTENMTVTAPAVANNPGAVTLKINKATGAVTGTFTVKEGTLVRKNIAYQGQIVTLANGTTKAAGYFLLPQIPTGPTQKPTATPILSGSVFVVQPSAIPAP